MNEFDFLCASIIFGGEGGGGYNFRSASMIFCWKSWFVVCIYDFRCACINFGAQLFLMCEYDFWCASLIFGKRIEFLVSEYNFQKKFIVRSYLLSFQAHHDSTYLQ